MRRGDRDDSDIAARESRAASSGGSTRRSPAGVRWLQAVALIAVCFAVYSDGYDHAFHLDSRHSILENPAVRDLRRIPEYFISPECFSSLRTNLDYRPVLLVAHAVNYRQGGYEMWWWHFTQILLHAVCVLGLYALCLRVLALGGPADAPRAGPWIAFASALVFAIHPTGSGVVNYLSARSSLLTAAFLFWAVVAYARPAGKDGYPRAQWSAALLFAFALFTKVEAIACLAVFFLYEVWQTARRNGHASGFFADAIASARGTTLRRMAPLLVAALVYLVVRWKTLGGIGLQGAASWSNFSGFDYFLNQVIAWWYYVGHWFAPVGLVADRGEVPERLGLADGRVLMAMGAWILVGTFLVSQWRTRPHLLFLALSALALVSPTSSFVPLAEMVNEHRPYMPVAVLSLCWMIPLGLAAWRVWSLGWAGRLSLALGGAALTGGLVVLTRQRNAVFESNESYWADVVAKAPSGRAYSNYGQVRLRRGEYEAARDLFEKALELTPSWHIPHINMALVHEHFGDHAKARESLDRAVEYDLHSGSALTWRGEYRLRNGAYAEALADFQASLSEMGSLELYKNYRGLATAWAGHGDAVKSFEYTRRCLELEPERTQLEIVPIVAPFFEAPERHEAGLEYFSLLEELLPDAWWVYHNKGTLAARLGRTELSEQWLEKARELKDQ